MSIFTSYRPNFCCECGHKIVRLRWFVWTSRRFCDKCSRTFAKTQWLRPSLSLLALLLCGVLVGRGCRRAPAPLIIERAAPVQTASANGATANSPPTTDSSTTRSGTTVTVTADDVYICGARTKKGTPCSRRVHGPVRCWQHKGASAMLPQEKLRIKE
jgi:hypothetical protein